MLTFFQRVQSSTPGAMTVEAGTVPTPGYRLRRLRGRGGFAEVWEADGPSGPAALKFMVSANTTTTARELRSLQSLQALDHPYLVHTNRVYTVPGYVVIDMELADATLLDLLHVYHNDLGQHFDPKELARYLWQVADALDFLNARRHTRDGRKVGFQHGDVKPNNVLLFGDVAKLTDYGLATATHGPTTPCPRHGTRDYAAPEVFGGTLSDASDQYSLAVMYHVLRTGRFPFPPVNPDAPVKVGIQPPPDLSRVPAAERPPLARALSVAPGERFPCCKDLMTALLKALGLKAARADNGSWRMDRDDEADGPKSQLIRSTPRSSHFRTG